MSRPRIGVLLIGQTPREDLTSPLAALHSDNELLIRGALDTLSIDDLPPCHDGDEAYPLSTRLRDKTLVSVDESFLEPRLQSLIDDFERQDVSVTILLCAGEFAALTSQRPLLRPFDLTADILRCAGFDRIAVLVPSDDQIMPSERKWQRENFQPLVLSLEEKPSQLSVAAWLASKVEGDQQLAALVIDYVGYPEELFEAIKQGLEIPVFDVGRLSITTLACMLARPATEVQHSDIRGDACD